MSRWTTLEPRQGGGADPADVGYPEDMPDHDDLVTTDQLKAAVGEVRVEIANLDKQLAGELAELRTEVRTGFANVNTAIAKLAEQHARTETHRLRWTLGAIVTGSALGVAILRLLDG